MMKWFINGLKEASTGQGRQNRYNRAHQKITSSPTYQKLTGTPSYPPSNQQPMYNQPGQFQQPMHLPPQQRRGDLGQWYRTRTRKVKFSLGCGCLLAALLLFSCVVSSFASRQVQPPPSSVVQVTHPSPTATKQALQPTPVPTQKPMPTPTPKPSPTPTPKRRPTPIPVRPTPTPVPRLAISFTCAVAVDYSYGNVCVHTSPAAALTIEVVYCTGYSAVSSSLQGTFYASGNGNYEWSWTPQTKCRGPATATVTANWNGQSVSNTDNFNVQ